MRDISISMITVNRFPAANYLFGTLANLKRGGVFDSPRLHSFHLVDSKSDTWLSERPETWENGVIQYYSCRDETPRNPIQNAAYALFLAGTSGAPWSLFLEDDIDVCAQFLDSVGAWLDDHARDSRRVYPFGASYEAVLDSYRGGKTSWEYPIDSFYGTQAFAIRASDALSLADFFFERPAAKGTYDLVMHEWSKIHYPKTKNFLASVPSFVEHEGRESVIAPRPETHRFPAWAGREYSYQSKVDA